MPDFFATFGSRHGMIAAFVGCLIFIVRSLIQRSRNIASGFNLDDLLIGDDGKASKTAAVMFGSFGVTSWVIVYLALEEKLTEGYFGAYIAAWVVPIVTKIIKGSPDVSRTSTVVATETVTK